MQIIPRRSADRGHADHDWLKSYHTFSFASYFDHAFTGFSSLRVINEDRVHPSTGFGTHSHREYEIFSYIIDGELQHKDSMGNVEILKRGDVQFTSTGTGIAHSEYNINRTHPVHFLQIWAKPSESGLQPSYYTETFSDEAKKAGLVRLIAPSGKTGKGEIPIVQDFYMYASILGPDAVRTHVLQGEEGKERKAYVHVTMRSGYVTPKEGNVDGGAMVRVNGDVVLKEGDGAFIVGKAGEKIELATLGAAGKDAEIVLFDLA
ncbi:RmlC-like cupin [Saitoella complicata NRRL Y-17804]|nr:RmlC-like cupin [Saitoella complicata NRRL Y-17804]ODQ55048.1 RmlC-like cupin [Saitoella complicata NRRL Y-17804]